MKITSYFEPTSKPSWRLIVVVLYKRVRLARVLRAETAARFRAGSASDLQAWAVLTETKAAFDALRRLPLNEAAKRKPFWRLAVTVLYIRVRLARDLHARTTTHFGVDSESGLQSRAVLTEAKAALDALRRLPSHPSSGKWLAAA